MTIYQTVQQNPPLQMRSPDLFFPDTTVPLLRPLQAVPLGTPQQDSPQGMWKKWFALPKKPLIVTAEFASAIDGSLPPLDTILSIAAMDAAPAPWNSNGEAWVVPLPLQLLGVVPIRRKNSPVARIPIWADTYFLPQDEDSRTVFESLCIGHEETVRELLQQVLRVGRHTTLKVSVREAHLSTSEAEEAIVENRPMPKNTTHFAPPYRFDWAGLR